LSTGWLLQLLSLLSLLLLLLCSRSAAVTVLQQPYSHK